MLRRAEKCVGFYVRTITTTQYEVRGNDLKTQLVDFNPGNVLGTCTCGAFQQMWFPCVHACACATELRNRGDYPNVKHDFEVMYDHTSVFYSLQFYKNAYAGTIHTPPNPATWDTTEVPPHIKNCRPLPPKKVVKVGRDKEKRHKPMVETVREKKRGTGTYGCSHCKTKGHTKKICPELKN